MANVTDRQGALDTIAQNLAGLSAASSLLLDGGYTGNQLLTPSGVRLAPPYKSPNAMSFIPWPCFRNVWWLSDHLLGGEM